MNVRIMFLLVIISFIFVGCGKSGANTDGISGIDISSTETGVNGENIPVSRAYAAKMSALLCGSHKEINLSDDYMDFNDVSTDKWYGKYVNFCYKNDIIKGTEGKTFEPEKNLTLSEAQYFINALDKTGDIQIHITDDTKDKPLSLSLWNTIYEKLISATENTQVREEEFSIFADSHLYAEMKDNYVITDKGVYCCDGIDISSYENCRLKAFVRDNDIISITEITDKNGFMKNAFIKSAENGMAVIYVNGVERKFTYDGDLLNEDMNNGICDFYFNDNVISRCSVYSDRISGTVKSADEEKAEISSAGILKYDSDIKFYCTDGENVEQADVNCLIPGRKCDFILDNGKIRAVITEKEYIPEEIYVHIKNGTSDYFDNLIIVKDGSEINLNKSELNERMIIEPEENKLIIRINGQDSEIAGRLEAVNSDNGIILTNVTGIEDFVSAVSAKKTDESMNGNMLDVIAVITRTEVINNIYKNSMAQLGASADNSASASPSESVLEAVNRTKGEVILSDGNVVNPLYFSCSCGNTADNGEVWADPSSGIFPWNGSSCLKHIGTDLSDNVKFAEFIENNSAETSEDAAADWYRWEYTVSYQALSQGINGKIGDLCEKYENYIKVLDTDGVYRSQKITEVGDIKNIQVTERGKGGNAMEIEIKGSSNVVKVRTMPAISEILSAEGMEIKKSDGSTEKMNVLPSVFFEFVDNGESIGIKGGGRGHGVGLSLTGAQAMSQSSGYREIIEKYYSGVSVEKFTNVNS